MSHMYPKPYNRIGGIFVHNQVKALLEKGCRVTVVSPVRQMPFPLNYTVRKWRARKTIPERVVWEGVPIFHPHYQLIPRAMFYWTSGLLMYRGIRSFMEELSRQFSFDLIHAHVALPDGYAAVMLKQTMNVPVVVTIHGVDFHSTIRRNQRCKDAVGKVLAQADHIITVSNKLKRIAAANYGCENKTTTIANGIHPFIYPGSRNNDQKIMVSVSNLMKSKGIDLNLKAFAALMDRHPALSYKIIGSGPELSGLRKLLKQLHIPENRVSFMGRLPNQEVLRHMSEADFFSLPSWEEGFGVVYIEAMSQGKPVIACRGQGIADVIEHEVNGLLVEPRSVDSLVRAIDYLLNNPKRAAEMGKNAQKTVLAGYTWARNAEETVRVYRQVLGV